MINLKRNIIRILWIGFIWIALVSRIHAQSDSFPYRIEPDWNSNNTEVAIDHDNIIEIWQIGQNQPRLMLLSHTDTITMVRWSPDGTRLASSSLDKTVKIWDSTNGTLIKTLTGYSDAVTAILWEMNGERLWTWGLEERPNLLIWNTSNWELIASKGSGSVTDVKLSPSGEYIVFSASLALSLIEVDTFSPILSTSIYNCCSIQMYTIDWHPNNNNILTGSINGKVTVWDRASLTIQQELTANSYSATDSLDITDISLSWVRDVAFSSDGTRLMAISGDGTLKIWDSTTYELLSETHLPAPILSASFSPDASQLAYLTDSIPFAVIPVPLSTALTPTPTSTFTPSPTDTATSTFTPTPTPTDTATSTFTPTPNP